MWFQRHEEPKTITDEFEQVRITSVCSEFKNFNVSANVQLCAFLFVFKLGVFFVLGNIHLLWLWEMGPAEEGGLHVWVPVPRRPRPPVTCRETRQDWQLRKWEMDAWRRLIHLLTFLDLTSARWGKETCGPEGGGRVSSLLLTLQIPPYHPHPGSDNPSHSHHLLLSSFYLFISSLFLNKNISWLRQITQTHTQ